MTSKFINIVQPKSKEYHNLKIVHNFILVIYYGFNEEVLGI